jgi:glucosyl-dolichyl phosphate glucuronosyltransferase
MDISVIVCTYNRARLLTKMLDSFFAQEKLDTFTWEFIVVDNNSSDDTRDVVRYFHSIDQRVSYCHESEQGLSHARNRGIKEAKGVCLAFADDDVIVDKNWLPSLVQVFNETDAIAVGGKIIADFGDFRPPQWIIKNQKLLTGPLVSHDYGNQIFEYTFQMNPFVGANMSFRRDVFGKFGEFNVSIGFNSKEKISIPGEDSSLFRYLRKANQKVFYSGQSVVYHPVDPIRCTWQFIAKYNIGYGRYLALASSAPKPKYLIRGVPRWIFKQIVIELICFIFFIFNGHKRIFYFMLIFRKFGAAYQYSKMHKGRNA